MMITLIIMILSLIIMIRIIVIENTLKSRNNNAAVLEFKQFKQCRQFIM